jgi:hypothetical protein
MIGSTVKLIGGLIRPEVRIQNTEVTLRNFFYSMKVEPCRPIAFLLLVLH